MKELNPAERRALRARAHHLHPVIMIGEAGLTPAVLNEIDNALKGRELIKIRVLGHDRRAREALIGRICAALAASPVQHIGK
ncbi:MAG: YhbY family RNA-binding protein, partial [Burkholderiales bacterium]